MKQRFITVKGRVVVERDTLFVKTTKFYFFESAFAQIAYAFIPTIALTISILRYEKPMDFVRILFWSVLFIGSLPKVWKVLVKWSFASRIPVSRIVDFQEKPDQNGLETHVDLLLRSGRTRRIRFRTLEKQYEAFTEFLSQHIAQPQLA